MIKLVTHPEYSFDFPAKHRFPMEKFGLLHRYLQDCGLATSKNTVRPGRIRQDILEQAHCPDYLHRFIHNRQTRQEQRRMGLPWSEGLRKRTLISPNGTLLAATIALEEGIACHLAGGTHHAHHDFASGFCILNDLAIAAIALNSSARQRNNADRNILIFDCDVHQGDGTASILQGHSEIFTCSIHCEKNFPARKAVSDLDIGVKIGTPDDIYLSTVKKTIDKAIELSKPSLIFYDAGVDVYKNDPLGLIDISLEGIRERDRLVLEACRQQGIPVATVIGGGYDNDREALARRHAIVTEEAFRCFEPLFNGNRNHL